MDNIKIYINANINNIEIYENVEITDDQTMLSEVQITRVINRLVERFLDKLKQNKITNDSTPSNCNPI